MTNCDLYHKLATSSPNSPNTLSHANIFAPLHALKLSTTISWNLCRSLAYKSIDRLLRILWRQCSIPQFPNSPIGIAVNVGARCTCLNGCDGNAVNMTHKTLHKFEYMVFRHSQCSFVLLQRVLLKMSQSTRWLVPTLSACKIWLHMELSSPSILEQNSNDLSTKK